MENPSSYKKESQKSLIKKSNFKKYGWWIFSLVLSCAVIPVYLFGELFCNQSEHTLPLPNDLVDAKVKLIFGKNITVFKGKGFAEYSPRCSPYLDQIGRFITFDDPQGLSHYENATLEHLPVGVVLTLDRIMAQRDYGLKAIIVDPTASVYWILKNEIGTTYILADYHSDMVEVYKKDGSSLRGMDSFYAEKNIFPNEIKKINSL